MKRKVKDDDLEFEEEYQAYQNKNNNASPSTKIKIDQPPKKDKKRINFWVIGAFLLGFMMGGLLFGGSGDEERTQTVASPTTPPTEPIGVEHDYDEDIYQERVVSLITLLIMSDNMTEHERDEFFLEIISNDIGWRDAYRDLRGNWDHITHEYVAHLLQAQDSESDYLTFGSTFVFDGFEIEIGEVDDIIWLVVDNRLVDVHEHDVVGIPVTVTNHSGETGRLNSFYYVFFGANGTQLSSVSAFFREYDIHGQGDMRDGASQSGYFLMLYDGDGYYFIEFSRFWEDVIEVKLPITK